MNVPNWKEWKQISLIIATINSLIPYSPLMRNTIMNTTRWCDWPARERDIFILHVAGYSGVTKSDWEGTLEKQMRDILSAIRGFMWDYYGPETFSDMLQIPTIYFCPIDKNDFNKWLAIGAEYGKYAISYNKKFPIHWGSFGYFEKGQYNK